MSVARGLTGQALALLSLLALLGIAGCGDSSSAKRRIDAEYQSTGKTRDAVFPLAGQVLIDGRPFQPKKPSQKLIVMLHDVAAAGTPVGSRPYVECGPDGRFVFSTLLDADGVPAGHYILTFAQLTHRKKRGYVGPDGLKNLYNDPEKNAASDRFNIEHQARGKTDYVFDLKIEGEEPISTPGPKAVSAIDE